MRRLLLGAVALVLACEGAATLPAPSQPSRAATPTMAIDVSGMMGAFPAWTFFVVTEDAVKAVALLNHTTKFTVATSGAVQVASGNGHLYIADETSEGTRLRSIEPTTGRVFATSTEPSRKLVATGIGHGALAVEANPPRLLALYADGARRVVEAYDPFSLRPLGTRLEASCGDRLLAAADRVVVPCLADGTLVIKDGAADALVLNAEIGPLVAAAVSSDGTTLVGRSDGRLSWIQAKTSTLVQIAPFRVARLIPDGIASFELQRFAVALLTSDHQIGVSETGSAQRYVSFPASMVPSGGILAEGQFAYWTSGGAAMHIDLQQGFYETMVLLTDSRVLPGAVGQ